MKHDLNAHMGAVAEEPVQIQLSKRERQALRQCEMLRGDEDGPKGQCEQFASLSCYFRGLHLRVCPYHWRVIQRSKNVQEGSA